MTEHLPLSRLDELADRSRPLDPDASAREALLAALTDHVQRFLAGVDSERTLGSTHDAQSALALSEFPPTPRGMAQTLALLEDHVDHSGVALTSPRNVGYIPAGGLFHSALAGLLAGVTNRYTGLRDISPGAVDLETATVRWLADSIGYPAHAHGVLTSGASIATTAAVAVIRDQAELMRSEPASAVVYLTSQTHHCLAKALHLCGLQNVVRRQVAVDGRRRMLPEDLNRAIVADRAAGRRPWLVVATAGTVSTGAVDPLDDIADVCAREGLWLHVDAAYGGLFALCPEGRQVLGGLDRADSVVLDPHKTLFLPYGTGALLLRDGRLLAESFAADASYLDRQIDLEESVRSPADLSPELTRPFRALGLWLPLQLAGTDAFVAALSEKILLARYLHRRLADEPGFEVAHPPDLSIVAFQARPPAPSTGASPSASAFTAALARRLRAGGRVFATSTRLEGQVYLRAAIGSFRTHLDDVEAAFDAIVDEAGRLAGKPTSRRRPVGTSTRAKGHLVNDPRLEVLVDVEGPDEDAARQCELEVLGHWYGDTPDLLEKAYGPYEDDTVFLALRHERHGVVGFARLITPGALPLKTIADIGKPPWSADGERAARLADLDLARTWDIATIGVRPDVGVTGRVGGAALYRSIIHVALANGIRSVVAIIDRRVRALLASVGLVLNDLPGTTPLPYMGSEACSPVFSHIADTVELQRVAAPQFYRYISLGEGMDTVALPQGDGLLLRQHNR